MQKVYYFLLIYLLNNQVCVTENTKKHVKGIYKYSLNIDDERKLFLQNLLQDILTPLQSSLKCMAILCDSYYQDVFSYVWFTKPHLPSYFKVSFKENEDLLSPNFLSLQVIRKVKNDGCEIYIVLITNGLQLSRFLRFGDRYRMLNTEAKFILLYDARLFTPDLHYLWKKFVNVIFLRYVEGYRIGQQSTHSIIPWYEILTVPFPSPISELFVAQRLDTWRNGKFRTGVDLFRDKTSNLQNQTLQVVTFQHIPSAVMYSKSRESGKFTGLEIEVLKTFANKMNFQPKIYEQNKTAKWGHKLTNGSYTGLLREVVNGRAEIALGNLYYTPYFLNLMDLSIPYITQCLTFLTPEILTDNSWKTLILPLKPLMWTAVIVTLFLGGFIFYALTHIQMRMYKKMTKQTSQVTSNYMGSYSFDTICNGILYTYGMLLLVSLPKLPTGWSLRLLTGWWWIYCILVVVAYRASLTAILANPAPRLTIDTLDQLAQSHISCGGWGEFEKDFFLTSLDESGKRIGQKFEVVLDEEEAIGKVAKGEFAYYGNIFFLRHARMLRQFKSKPNDSLGGSTEVSSIAGEKSLHIMSECAINMPISIGLEKNSPLKSQIDKFLYNIVEAGLVKKWLYNVMQRTVSLENILEDTSNTSALMNLRKLYGALVALGIGYFFSLVVLVGEILHWRYVVKKSPYYDKYDINLYYKRREKYKIKKFF